MSNILLVDSVLFDVPSQAAGDSETDFRFKMAANRYCTPSAPEQGGPALTLLFAHGNGLHKEYWEPTLQKLLAPPSGPGSPKRLSSGAKIREAWAFDALDHGDSAVANSAILEDMKDGVSVVEWARAIAAFVQVHLMSHRIVLVGHSVGTVAIVYSMLCFPTDAHIPYEAMVIIEPPMHDKQLRDENYADRTGHIKLLTKAVAMQPSDFDTREKAYEVMCKRMPWKICDDRSRRLFVNNGMRPKDQSRPLGPVTTKCHKSHEIAKFHEWDPMFEAVDHITKTCARFPYHFIFGAVNDIVPRYVQDNAVSSEKGRNVASVTRMPGTGHMLVQQRPDELADVLREILERTALSASLPTHRL
ncbi:Alpha/Beta hydrolase protein [Cytidiella melzeri]|nr:Alpha/Beta hydrolase protein [Cytidiella melzeri]